MKGRLLNIEDHRILLLLGIHLGLGILISIYPALSFYWQVAVVIFAVFDILRNRNRNDEAALWSAYFAGMEVFLRMTGASVFWEFGKYIVILFLLIGLLFNRRKLPGAYVVYFLLLVPSALAASYADYAEARDMISFNLSGPLCLAVSCMYFFNRKYTASQFFGLFRAITLPILVMLIYLLVTSPDLSGIDFGSQSNFTASGGYGPNQVSTMLGIGIFMVAIFRFFGASFSGIKWLDYALLAALLFRALVTFSRGGVFGAGFAIAVFVLLTMFGTLKGKRFYNYVFISVLMVGVAFVVWDYTNSITKNALEYRYRGIDPRTGREREYTTGRIAVMTRDFQAFQNNLFMGLGPGKAKEEGKELGVEGVPAHTEWTRMLAEHGLLGAIALIMLFAIPVAHIFSLKRAIHPLLFALLALSLFSMFHAAMRISIIGYMYAWTLIILVDKPGAKPAREKRQAAADTQGNPIEPAVQV